MSDDWPTAILNITAHSSLVPDHYLPELKTKLIEILPSLHDNVHFKSNCRFLIQNVSNSDMCFADLKRFTPRSGQTPYSKDSPFEVAVITIQAPQESKVKPTGLNTTDIQEIAGPIKGILKSPPFSIHDDMIIVVPDWTSISIQQKVNK